MPSEPLQIALAIIRHPADERYLIALRRNDVHLPDLWEFPGGKCLPGESPGQCAVREAREEVGLVVAVVEAWPPVTFEYPERTVMLSPFLCRAGSADARPLESAQIVWVTPGDLSRYAFPPANAPLLARLQARTARPSSQDGQGCG